MWRCTETKSMRELEEENRIAAGPGVIPLEAFRQLSNKTGRRGA